jgi:hypothetical protein
MRRALLTGFEVKGRGYTGFAAGPGGRHPEAVCMAPETKNRPALAPAAFFFLLFL